MQNHQEEPTVGVRYGYYKTETFYDHDGTILRWVIIKGIKAVALRLREDFNPEIFNARAEVWVGADSPTCIWGDRLKDIQYSREKTLPIFVKRKDGRQYEYLGKFQYDGEIAAPHARCIKAAKNVPHRRGISRIVFLKRK